MIAILKDIKNGMLTPGEIPGFIMWLIGRAFWYIVAFLLLAGVGFLVMN